MNSRAFTLSLLFLLLGMEKTSPLSISHNSFTTFTPWHFSQDFQRVDWGATAGEKERSKSIPDRRERLTVWAGVHFDAVHLSLYPVGISCLLSLIPSPPPLIKRRLFLFLSSTRTALSAVVGVVHHCHWRGDWVAFETQSSRLLFLLLSLVVVSFHLSPWGNWTSHSTTFPPSCFSLTKNNSSWFYYFFSSPAARLPPSPPSLCCWNTHLLDSLLYVL